MREHLDRQKSSLVELQSAHTNLQMSSNDLQARYQRSRRDSRDSSAETSALKETLVKTEQELARYKQRTNEYESEVRNLRVELESVRDESRSRRHDLFAAQVTISLSLCPSLSVPCLVSYLIHHTTFTLTFM